MNISERTRSNIEYRCVLVRPHSHQLLAAAERDQYRLPRIHIPEWTRPAEELQKAIKARWKLDVFVLETWAAGHQAAALVVAELLDVERNSSFVEFPVRSFKGAEFSEEDCQHLESLLEGRTKIPFPRLGWIYEAMAWVESVTGATFSSKRNIAQWNAGGGFAGDRDLGSVNGSPDISVFEDEAFIQRIAADCFLCKPRGIELAAAGA